MSNKPYKNYKGETVTNCPKAEGTCLEPNHFTKKQFADMRSQGSNVSFDATILPKDTVATVKSLKNMTVGRTHVAGNPALEVSFPELGNRKVYLVDSPEDEYYNQNVVILFSDSEFVGDDAYNGQLSNYAKYGQAEVSYTVVKDAEGKLFFSDSIVGGLIAFEDLDKAEPLRETFDEYLTDDEKIMFDNKGKIISDTVLPSLTAKAKEWLVEHAAYIEGTAPDNEKEFWNYFTTGEIVSKVEPL